MIQYILHLHSCSHMLISLILHNKFVSVCVCVGEFALYEWISLQSGRPKYLKSTVMWLKKSTNKKEPHTIFSNICSLLLSTFPFTFAFRFFFLFVSLCFCLNACANLNSSFCLNWAKYKKKKKIRINLCTTFDSTHIFVHAIRRSCFKSKVKNREKHKKWLLCNGQRITSAGFLCFPIFNQQQKQKERREKTNKTKQIEKNINRTQLYNSLFWIIVYLKNKNTNHTDSLKKKIKKIAAEI